MELVNTNQEGPVREHPVSDLGCRPPSNSEAFTLLELLAVIGIIGLIAALLFPAVIRTRVQAKKQRARVEIAQIVSALNEYDSTYGRFPVSAEVVEAADALREDMTYGGVIQETHTWLAGPGYMADNSELMGGLLDLEYFGDGAPTLNQGHVQNPKRLKFLEANLRDGTNALPGIGIDGMYRDPWGSPYMVSLDLNGDGRVRDVLYSRPSVAQEPANPEHGLCNLVRGTNAQGNPVFELPGAVLVWSAGPDRHISTCDKADRGVNRDNILSWGP
jgi:type II secretory pathway pseudopilin PulG